MTDFFIRLNAKFEPYGTLISVALVIALSVNIVMDLTN